MRLFLPLLMLALAGSVHAAAAPKPDTMRTVKVTLHGNAFTTELATDEKAREHGLMDRKELRADHAMLFVFPDLAPRWFWMKNTLIPLDILYFSDKRELVSMQLNVPPCTADPCPSYPSGAAARYVLELPAGTVAQRGIQVGDKMDIEGAIGPVH